LLPEPINQAGSLIAESAGLAGFHKKQRAPQEKLIPRRPALGLSVAQPNPSVANCVRSNHSNEYITKIVRTIAARRYKQMATSQKNGDVSVAIM
jgi:hypothetical protein